MKALSIWQPWASAIPLGLKRFETRSWNTEYRGPLVIHAAKRWEPDQKRFADSELTLGRLPQHLPLGALVAVVNLVDCRRIDNASMEISALERSYGDYTDGRWAWQLSNVVAFNEPIPWRGEQGLFDVPSDLIRANLSTEAWWSLKTCGGVK